MGLVEAEYRVTFQELRKFDDHRALGTWGTAELHAGGTPHPAYSVEFNQSI
jgi:hypothetical protein